MSDFTFLTEEQCFSDDKLDILKKRGTKAEITDFSILLGGWIDRDSDYWLLGACREFIRKYCDPEYLEVYDIYWAGRDERRMEKIAELQDEEISLHRGEEAEEYAKYGARAYKGIGQMYSGYLEREKEDNRGEENDERK